MVPTALLNLLSISELVVGFQWLEHTSQAKRSGGSRSVTATLLSSLVTE